MESGLICLSECLPCCKVGKQLTVITKAGFQFFAEITQIDSCCKQIKFQYAEDESVTGVQPAYSFLTKDIYSVKCKSCCDDNFYEISKLTDVALLDDGIIGHIYVYIGTPDDPLYVWKYTGQGSYKNPAKYILIERPVYDPYDLYAF